MNHKNKRFNQVCIVFLLITVAIFYLKSNDEVQAKPPEHETKPVDKNFPPKNQLTRVSLGSTQQLTNPPLVKPEQSVIKKKNTEINYPVVTKLQGKEILKSTFFSTIDQHQCRLEVDRESIQRINELLEIMNIDHPLTKVTYKINKYLILNVISSELPDNFNNVLIKKIEALLNIYNHSFGIWLQKKSEINLVILPNKDAYNAFIDSIVDINISTQGLFWTKSNYAFAAFKNENQLEKTAFHEVVHALDFALVGLKSRWLSEGLAQLFQGMKVYKNNKVELTVPYFRKEFEPMSLQDLILADEQWWDESVVHDLNLNSLYLLTYLYENRKNTNIISDLMQAERKNLCDKLPMRTYVELLGEAGIINMPASLDVPFVK